MKFLGRSVSDAVLMIYEGISPRSREEYNALFRDLGLNVHEVVLGEPDCRERVFGLIEGGKALVAFLGGKDIDPKRWGEELRYPDLVDIDEDRDAVEFELLEVLVKEEVPVVGICRGMQVINVFFGGSLWQDITRDLSYVVSLCPAHQNVTELTHEAKRKLAHKIRLAKTLPREVSETLKLFKGEDDGWVTSRHHQAVRDLGKGLKAIAYSRQDGLIEAIVHETLPILGVQWHPESPLPLRISRRMYILEDKELDKELNIE